MENDGMKGMDRANTGPDYDAHSCQIDPEECRGELRDSCMGCDYWSPEGEWIHETPKQ
jgi:hypothetical protein